MPTGFDNLHTETNLTTKQVKVSAVMIVLNEAAFIEHTLQRLAWCDEIIVVDSGSTDNTVEICNKYNCRVFQNTFKGYGEQKNFALSKAQNDWILSIDADEVLSEESATEIPTTILRDQGKFAGYLIPMNLVYLGKEFRIGSESHKFFLRLFNKNTGSITRDRVHEKIEVNGAVGKLNGRLLHYSYREIAQCLNKVDTYSTLSAKESYLKNKTKPKFLIPISIPFHFLKYYIIDLNFLNGIQGFHFAIFGSFYHYLKYIKLEELHRLGLTEEREN